MFVHCSEIRLLSRSLSEKTSILFKYLKQCSIKINHMIFHFKDLSYGYTVISSSLNSKISGQMGNTHQVSIKSVCEFEFNYIKLLHTKMVVSLYYLVYYAISIYHCQYLILLLRVSSYYSRLNQILSNKLYLKISLRL